MRVYLNSEDKGLTRVDITVEDHSDQPIEIGCEMYFKMKTTCQKCGNCL